MNQQPEALLMAEHLDDRGLIEEAAELRRLYAENEALRKAASRALEALTPPHSMKARNAINSLQNAMKGQA